MTLNLETQTGTLAAFMWDTTESSVSVAPVVASKNKRPDPGLPSLRAFILGLPFRACLLREAGFVL